MCQIGSYDIGVTLETQETITPVIPEPKTYIDSYNSNTELYNSMAPVEEYKGKDTFDFSWSRGCYGNQLKNYYKKRGSHFVDAL